MTFTPEAPLALLARYTATLGGVTSLAGVQLEQPKTWQFTVRDGTRGEAMAAWAQSTGGVSRAVMSRHFTSGAWTDANRLSGNNLGGFDVAMDAQGDAVALWVEWGMIPVGIWSDRFTSGAWDGKLELADGLTQRPQVAMDPIGNAIAVWDQVNGPYPSIYSRSSTPSGDWGVQELVENSLSSWGPFSEPNCAEPIVMSREAPQGEGVCFCYAPYPVGAGAVNRHRGKP